MDQPGQPHMPPPKPLLTHDKVVSPVVDSGTDPEQISPTATVSSPASYPIPTRRLPGNKDASGLPSFGVAPQLRDAMAAQRVRTRVQSLYVYVVTTVIFGGVIALLVNSHSAQFRFGDIPRVLQALGFITAAIPSVLAPILLASKLPSRVGFALMVQLIAYGVAFVTAFVIIVNNFAYFFTGIGLLAVLEACFGLWTRSVLGEVRELPLLD
jgi:hypothetical protein